MRPSVSFALRHSNILPFSPLDHRLLSSRRHYLQETSQLLQKSVFFLHFGATNFPLFMAGNSSVNSISCRQVVDIHKPSAHRFRPLVVPLQTNFLKKYHGLGFSCCNTECFTQSLSLRIQPKFSFGATKEIIGLKKKHCSVLRVKEQRLLVVLFLLK